LGANADSEEYQISEYYEGSVIGNDFSKKVLDVLKMIDIDTLWSLSTLSSDRVHFSSKQMQSK